ncbi:MAG: hypothetical protein ACXAC0_10245 [Candidatus Thorarchaeota archaeon]
MSRSSYEKHLHDTGISYSFLLTIPVAILLQFLGYWQLMILAGTVGATFVRRHIHAFIAGFLGVAAAWSILFVVLVAVAQAYVVGEVFAILIGAPGFGRFIVSLSILFGGLLGGSGALVGYSLIDLVKITRSEKEPS